MRPKSREETPKEGSNRAKPSLCCSAEIRVGRRERQASKGSIVALICFSLTTYCAATS
jgi:hypothetical protein